MQKSIHLATTYLSAWHSPIRLDRATPTWQKSVGSETFRNNMSGYYRHRIVLLLVVVSCLLIYAAPSVSVRLEGPPLEYLLLAPLISGVGLTVCSAV